MRPAEILFAVGFVAAAWALAYAAFARQERSQRAAIVAVNVVAVVGTVVWLCYRPS